MCWRNSRHRARADSKMPSTRQMSQAGKKEPTMSKDGARLQPDTSHGSNGISKKRRTGVIARAIPLFHQLISRVLCSLADTRPPLLGALAGEMNSSRNEGIKCEPAATQKNNAKQH